MQFARMASGKSCTPSEGGGASKDSKEPSSYRTSSLSSVNQSNMMPNPNQQRAAQQRCETASEPCESSCEIPTSSPQPSSVYIFSHPFFRTWRTMTTVKDAAVSFDLQNRKPDHFERQRRIAIISRLFQDVLKACADTQHHYLGHLPLTTSHLAAPRLSSSTSTSTAAGACRRSACLQPFRSAIATETCRNTNATRRARGNILVNRCSTTLS